ncbi:MAG: holo-ACP synthase [Gammaproteobacteria bacterium]|nr:holo-ACP synthase [Gammaproteobacteria bacterium]
MIYGIGTDIVAVARIERNIARYGERFSRRILAPEELAGLAGNARPAHFLARRFAAKEATAKALGTGFRGGLRLTDIRVGHDGLGRPELRYAGYARRLVDELGITRSLVSIADERDHAVAYVTLLQGEGR